MNSQNRMNAGAEYVLYRIWAALQDENGIHAESLLTCVGALAGYACQVCVRQSAALPGADRRKYSLVPVENSDGMTYLYGDALNVPLSESPLSVWSFVGRAVQKLDKPLPDIEDIFSHVTQTVGTSAFGVPRVPDENRPHRPAIVYLRQVWPQILPIALKFCSRPMQIPVLFGIALQRALEQTRDMLSPTLGASIAMECAVAMSRVALPEPSASAAIAWPGVIAVEPNAAADSAPIRAIPPPGRRRAADDDEPSALRVGALVARIPPAARIVTMMFLAFITVAGVMYTPSRREAPAVAREDREDRGARALVGENPPEPLRVVEQPTQLAQVSPEQLRPEPQRPEQQLPPPQLPEQLAEADVPLVEPADIQMNEDRQRLLMSSSDGSSEGVMRDEGGESQD